MRVMVTGATGYIGFAVVQSVLAAGHEVTAYVRDRGSARSAGLASLGAELVEGRIDADDRLVDALRSVEVVAHLAWDADDPVAADLSFFDTATRANRDGVNRHLLLTSGCSSYGAQEHAVLDESTPIDPTTRRGRIELSPALSALSHTVFRPGMVFGGDSRSSIVGRWFELGRSGTAVVPGRQDKVWSWVHVDDVAAAYTAALVDLAEHDGRTYLLSADSSVTTRALIEDAARLAGQQGDVPAAPASAEDPGYRIFDRNEAIDARLAKAQLPWTPHHDDVRSELPQLWQAWSAEH